MHDEMEKNSSAMVEVIERLCLEWDVLFLQDSLVLKLTDFCFYPRKYIFG